MKVILYEDSPEKLYPLINLYPQFNLRIGMKTIAAHFAYFYKRMQIGYIARDIFKMKKISPNSPTLYFSAKAVINKKIPVVKEDMKFSIDSQIVGLVKYKPPYPKTLSEIKSALKTIKCTKKLSGFLIDDLWDLIKFNEAILSHNFKMKSDPGKTVGDIYLIGDKKDLHLAHNAVVHKLAFIDVSDGPVYIDQNAVVKPFSTIIGPSYIGPKTIIDRAKIIKSSIGPECRIGGEVEACIFQGYANKYHEGFIGHSFIGEWVNLGALTTNSDLKNNYSSVQIKVGNSVQKTEMIKLGCFIGDHTKTGIGTLIPTGAVIGAFVNFFGGGMMPKHVACFKWLTHRKRLDYKLEKAIATAKTVMQRRKVKMSRQYEKLIRFNYKWRSSL